MRKNISFIPLNNDINKLSAFIPSLDASWRANQRIKSKPVMVESLDAVREFQRQGWNIAGAYEKRDKNRKVGSHFIKMEHPDFVIKNSKGQAEAVATMNISNSCTGAKPMELDLGAYRQVCSNGLIAHVNTPILSPLQAAVERDYIWGSSRYHVSNNNNVSWNNSCQYA